MYESPSKDNHLFDSYDSNTKNSISNENLEILYSLINTESRHTNVYYDLQSKNCTLQDDLQNVNNSCERFENDEKIKSELLEENYINLMDCHKRNQIQLQEKLSYILNKLEETNSYFCDAFDNYNTKILKSSIQFFEEQTKHMDTTLSTNLEELNIHQLKSNITESLMKSKLNESSNIDIARSILLEFSMKRPHIEIEEICSKLIIEIKKLVEQREELKLILNKHE